MVQSIVVRRQGVVVLSVGQDHEKHAGIFTRNGPGSRMQAETRSVDNFVRPTPCHFCHPGPASHGFENSTASSRLNVQNVSLSGEIPDPSHKAFTATKWCLSPPFESSNTRSATHPLDVLGPSTKP